MAERVAVTGATGFTGGALARRLAADGYAVRALAREPSRLAHLDGVEVQAGDLSDEAALAKLVEGADVAFHVAAMFRKEGAYDEFVKANYLGTVNMLRAARRAGVRRFVHVSTIGVHGSVATTPADETAPFDPRDPYQETKLRGEEACREAMADGGMEIVIVRPCSIYGPGDLRMLKMFRLLLARRFFFVGHGRPNFHPVYIDDLVDGMLLAARVPQAAGETFILGGPRYLPLAEYVAIAAREVGVPPPRLRLPYGPLETAARLCEATFVPLGLQPPLHRRRLSFFKHNRAFSIEKARRVLGYAPAVGVEEGMRRTVAWYRSEGYLPPLSPSERDGARAHSRAA